MPKRNRQERILVASPTSGGATRSRRNRSEAFRAQLAPAPTALMATRLSAYTRLIGDGPERGFCAAWRSGRDRPRPWSSDGTLGCCAGTGWRCARPRHLAAGVCAGQRVRVKTKSYSDPTGLPVAWSSMEP